MNLKKNISSLKLPHYKATAGMESVRVAPPKEVLLPMNMQKMSTRKKAWITMPTIMIL